MYDIVYFYPNGHLGHFEVGHPERPERVEVIRNSLDESDLWEPFPHLAPLDLPEDVLKSVHSSAYLNMLELTCRRGGHLDADTYTTSATWDLALKAAGGAAKVAADVWEGNAHRAFALTRPPGHHATHGQGMGFCLLNNIAIAAEYLVMKYEAKRLAIVDFDLHHGNGTQEIFWERGDVFYLSTHQSPLYPGTGHLEDIGVGMGEGRTANFPLPPGSGDLAFNTILDEFIMPLLEGFNPQMILVSYGFDPHWLDPLGQLLLTADGYGRLISKLCNWADIHCAGKIALFLEGGYDLKAGSACSLAVVAAMLGKPWKDAYPCQYQEGNTWQIIMERAHSIWKL
jgi:acetoin utilization deacetylase AcuC-like enzyme